MAPGAEHLCDLGPAHGALEHHHRGRRGEAGPALHLDLEEQRGAHYVENADPSSGDTNITLSNFTLLGSGSGEPAGTNAQNGGILVSAVNVELATHWTIAHLQIEDSPGPSITYHGGSDITIEYNDCHNGGRDGITGYWDQGPSITNLSDVVIADNQISEVGDDAIAVLGAANNLRNPSGPLPSDITIEDNRIVGWPSNVNGSMLGCGINVSVVGPNVTVTDNYIENTYSAGLMISGCTSKWCPSGYKNWQTTGVSATDNTIRQRRPALHGLDRGPAQSARLRHLRRQQRRPHHRHGEHDHQRRFRQRGGGQLLGRLPDTTAVQDAINAAAAAGEVVWLPAQSTYVISGRLTVPSNTTIEGAGVSSVLRFTWTSGAWGAHYIENADPSGGDTNITLSNFTLLGSGSGEPAGTNAQNGGNLVSAVNVELATHWTIAHLQIEDSPGPSITYHGGSDITIEYNDCHNGGRDGITGYWDQGPSITNLSDVVIADNQISEVGDDAIAVLGAANNLRNPSGPLPSDITIEDNRIVGWPSNVNGSMLGRGINVSVVGPNVTVTDNYIENTYSAGLMISGCTSKWCPSGYKNWQTTGVSATDNTIVNAGQLYAGSTEGQHNQPGYGIYVANSAAPITVTGNTITNAALGNVEVASCSGGCQIQSG